MKMDRWAEENRRIKEEIIKQLNLVEDSCTVTNSIQFDVKIHLRNLTMFSDAQLEQLQKAIQTINQSYTIKKWLILPNEKLMLDVTVWC